MGLFRRNNKPLSKKDKSQKIESDTKTFSRIIGKRKTLTIDEAIDIEELLED